MHRSAKQKGISRCYFGLYDTCDALWCFCDCISKVELRDGNSFSGISILWNCETERGSDFGRGNSTEKVSPLSKCSLFPELVIDNACLFIVLEYCWVLRRKMQHLTEFHISEHDSFRKLFTLALNNFFAELWNWWHNPFHNFRIKHP